MSTIGNIGNEEGGNTRLPPKRIVPSKKWVFTFNNYTDEILETLAPKIDELCDFYIVGKEVGESGTKHLQGYLEFKVKKRPIEAFGLKCIHWEKAKGSREQNIEYCKKDGDIWISRGLPREIKVIDKLYEWQQGILDIYKTEPDDRKVYWFYESKGNIGKTAFIKYMVVKHKVLFCNGGKYTDIMNLVFNQDMDNTNAVFFDIPRSHKGSISYASLESIKNGMVCNTKYETGTKIFNSPHLFIFANFPPEKMEDLSEDRWIIKCLDEDKDNAYECEEEL